MMVLYRNSDAQELTPEVVSEPLFASLHLSTLLVALYCFVLTLRRTLSREVVRVVVVMQSRAIDFQMDCAIGWALMAFSVSYCTCRNNLF